MPEESNGLTKAIHTVELTMARIEGKLDSALELKADVSKLREAIATTDDTARSADAKADSNAREIAAIKAGQRWAIGIIAPALVTIIIFILSMFR